MSKGIEIVVQMIEAGAIALPKTNEELIAIVRSCNLVSQRDRSTPLGGKDAKDIDHESKLRAKEIIIKRCEKWFHLATLSQNICANKWALSAGMGKGTVAGIVNEMVSNGELIARGRYFKITPDKDREDS